MDVYSAYANEYAEVAEAEYTADTAATMEGDLSARLSYALDGRSYVLICTEHFPDEIRVYPNPWDGLRYFGYLATLDR